MSHDAYIYDAIRTPRGKGKPGGGLYEVKPIDLVANLLEAMKERHNLDTTQVEDFICATGEPVKEQGQNIAKTALVYSSWDDVTVGAQLHRYCAGGLDAVNTVAMKIMAGMESMGVAGGVESMSRLGMGAGGAAAGDAWVAMQSYGISQGLGADLMAHLDGFSREDADRYACESQRRAAHARDNGYFDRSIVPVKDLNGVTVLAHDEHIRPTDMESLAKLKPSFSMFNDFGHGDFLKFKYPQVEKIDCIHTPGNSSGDPARGGAYCPSTSRASRIAHGTTPASSQAANCSMNSHSSVAAISRLSLTRTKFRNKRTSRSIMCLRSSRRCTVIPCAPARSQAMAASGIPG